MTYSALPEIFPLIFALDPVGSAILLPQELHTTACDA
jgi:hypothetical protein